MGFLVGDIAAGLQSLKAAKDIVQALNAVKGEAAINSVKIELQGHILDAQESLLKAQEAKSAYASRIAELEQKIASFEDWETEKQRYQLQAVDIGAFAYMYKPGMESGEAAVWLCQTCFENRHKSPLQFRAQDRGSNAAGGRGSHSRWGCNLCKAEIVVAYSRKPHIPWTPSGGDNPEPPSPGVRSVRVIRG